MFRLLSIEWLKIKRYNTFWILSVMFLALLFGWNYFVGSGILKLGNSQINILNLNYTFPAVWDNVGHWTKFFSGLIAIIIIILTTNEYQFRTNRQNVIDGWQRIQFFHAKWGIVVMLSLAVTLYSILQGLFFAIVYGSPLANMGEHFDKMFYVLILTLNYFGFALTMSMLIRRSGMAIIIFLVYTYVIEIMLQQLLNWKIDFKPGNLLPMQCSAELLNFPFIDSMKMMMKSSGPSPHVLVLTSIIWIIIYYLVGRMKILKSDW